MSLIFADGFDDNLPKWDGLAVPKTTGRNGQAGNVTPGTWTKSFGADAHATVIFGAAIIIDSPPYGVWNYFRLLGSDGSEHFRMTDVNNSYGRDFVFYVNGTARYTLSTMPLSQWCYLEVKLTVHDSTGYFEVRLDGVTLATFTGDTKAGAGANTINSLQISDGGGANGGPWQLDDLYVCNGAGSVNNDFLGDLAIETIYPNGNGDESDFVGSDGNSVDNYLLVDEAALSTADWAGGANVGDRDLYAMQNLTRATGVVRGVIPAAYMQNSDSGPRSAGVTAKSGATLVTPTSLALGAAPAMQSKVVELDPDTGTAWTVAAVNALQVGAEVTA